MSDMFSQLPFSDLSDSVVEHISQNDDTTLQEEVCSDLEHFIHISFEEKIPLKDSRSKNILQRDEFHAFILASYFSMYHNLFDNNEIQSYIPHTNSPLLILKEVQVNYEMHE